MTTPLDPSGLTDSVLACVTWPSQSLKCVCNQLPWWSGWLFGGQEKGERHICLYVEVGRFIAALEFINHLGVLMWC